MAAKDCDAHPERHSRIRIDAIAIIAPTHGLVEIEHLRSAF
jgi:hypothetical protein